MSWDISAFPLQDPSFPTACPDLENLFPFALPPSVSLPPSLSLCPSLSLSLSLFVETHEYHKGRFIGELQYKPSVFTSTKSKSLCLLRDLEEAASRLRLWVISRSNQTEHSWKQKHNTAKLSELWAHIISCCPWGNFLFCVQEPQEICFEG